jgi:hypothetical protein
MLVYQSLFQLKLLLLCFLKLGGKTSLVRTLATLCNTELLEFAMNSAVDTAELLGGFEQVCFSSCCWLSNVVHFVFKQQKGRCCSSSTTCFGCSRRHCFITVETIMFVAQQCSNVKFLFIYLFF